MADGHVMDLLGNGDHVRLQSRETGRYLHADGDGIEVCLHGSGPDPAMNPALNSVWRVEHWFSGARVQPYFLLQNVAYGRYLSFSLREAPPGHRGHRTTRSDRDEPNVLTDPVYPWMWTAELQNSAPPAPGVQDYVSLRYSNCYLRANGKIIYSNNRVTAEPDEGPRISSTMMHWRVRQVIAGPVPHALPVAHGRPVGLFSWWPAIHDIQVFPHPPRIIRHVRAKDEGEFDENNWDSFAFFSSSHFELRYALGTRQEDWNGNVADYALCMRPGSHGRLMPLITDLPRNLDTMDIVVFRNGTQAAQALLYPQPEAPAGGQGNFFQGWLQV